MTRKAFIAFGVIVCLLFIEAGRRGFVFSSMFQTARWGPMGHSGYHK